jgi:coiled-coil domain-containing protein 77
LESDLTNSIEQVDALRVSHEESHKLSWELEKKSRQVTELQQAMSDFQVALYDERKQLLAVVAENDSFKGRAGNVTIKFRN